MNKMKGLILGFLFALIACMFTGTDTVMAYTISEDGNWEYEIHEAETGNYIYMYEYLGNETDVIIPDTMDGYAVKGLLTGMMYQNNTVETIQIPNDLSFIDAGVFASAYALKEINMIDGPENSFHTENGILYRNNHIIAYPAGREDVTFVIPNGVTGIQTNSFYGCTNLEKVVVPKQTDFIFNTFCRCIKPLDIVIKNDIYDEKSLYDICWQMPVGTRILVANEELEEKYQAEMTRTDSYGRVTGQGNYRDVEDPMVVDVYDPVPATGLTFKNGKTEKEIYIEIEDKNYNWSSSFLGDYIQYPENTTENIKWEVVESDGSLVAFREPEHALSYIFDVKCAGNATVRGYDDSGHEIYAYYTIYSPMEDFHLDWFGHQDYCETETGDEEEIYASISDNRCYANTKGATWEIADTGIAEIIPTDKSSKYYCTLRGVSAGTTTLTATVNDNGTYVSRTMEVTVKDDIENCTVEAIPAQKFTGDKITPPVPEVTYNGRTLTEGVDYAVEYGYNYYGTGKAYLKGMGVFTGTKTLEFDIDTTISDCIIYYEDTVIYDGGDVKEIPTQMNSDITEGGYPELSLRLIHSGNSGQFLVEDTHYTLDYDIDVDNGNGSVTITGIGVFSGSKSLIFSIIKDVSLTDGVEISLGETYPMYKDIIKEYGSYTPVYTKPEDVIKELTITCPERELIYGTDYEITFVKNGVPYKPTGLTCFKEGEYELIVKGVESNGCIGSKTLSFTVYDNYDALMEELYGKEEPEPEPEPVYIDISTEAEASVGNMFYTHICFLPGDTETGYPMKPVYTKGAEILKTLKVVCNGKELAWGTDYKIIEDPNRNRLETMNLMNAGEYELTIVGLEKAGYTGTIVLKYTVVSNSAEKAKECRDKIESGQGGNKEPDPDPTPKPVYKTVTHTVVAGTKKIKVSKIADVSGASGYRSSDTSVAKVTAKGVIKIVRAGYTEITVTQANGTTTIKLYVVPKQMTIKSVKSSKKGIVTVKWTKDTQSSGYTVEYSTSKKFKNSTKKTLTKNSKVSLNIKGLKSKKKYYVKVTPYIIVNGEKHYGESSKVYKIKTK